jgi:hypothetical protein
LVNVCFASRQKRNLGAAIRARHHVPLDARPFGALQPALCKSGQPLLIGTIPPTLRASNLVERRPQNPFVHISGSLFFFTDADFRFPRPAALFHIFP